MLGTHALVLASSSFLTTLGLARPTMWLLERWRVVDVPNHRSSHERPTLRGGGLAVLGGATVTVLAALALGSELPTVALLGCLLLSGLGLLADTTDVGPVARFLAQAGIGAGAGWLLGGPTTALLGAVATPVLVNAVNFMDGINAITALTMSAWAVVSLLGAQVDGTLFLAALALGGALGFLPWNAPRARMFLGDIGSYLFGGLAATALLVEQSGGGRPVLVLAALVPYLLDTGVTLARRAVRGETLTEPHREHFYQRLARRPAWTHVRVAAVMSLAALATGSLALMALGHNGLL